MRLSPWIRKMKANNCWYPKVLPNAFKQSIRRKRIPTKKPHKYFLPFGVLKATNDFFNRYGLNQVEAYAWWAGHINSHQEAQVCTAILPTARSKYGQVHLDRKLLSVLHKKLIELDQILLVELHTHPPNAGGQNIIDACNAATYYNGFKSIVVPNFGLPELHDLRTCHVYSYLKDGIWVEHSAQEVEDTFLIDQTFCEVSY